MEVISIERSIYEELLTGIDPDEPLGIPSEKPGCSLHGQWPYRNVVSRASTCSRCCEGGE